MSADTNVMAHVPAGPLAAADPGSEAEFRLIDDLFDELFPICRSITGPGLRESLHILGRYMPLSRDSVASGEKVFDWEVPQEWRIHAARLTHEDGTVYADFAVNNLHVVNYSEPVDIRVSREELAPHLYSLPHIPDAAPYVFSYYQRNWGFCISDTVRQSMPAGGYHAQIESAFVPGQLDFADLVLPGETDSEILLTSYLCHPSMAHTRSSISPSAAAAQFPT